MFTIQEILEATGGRLINGNPQIEVGGISIDSRTIKPGELFIAIKGNRFDGHDFIKEAINKKATGVVISRPISQLSNSFNSLTHSTFIRVPNTIKALGQIAKSHRKKFNIPVVAITGSNGKTTTKEMVASILQKRYNVLKSSGTQNNHIGVPLTLLGLNSQHEFCVLEIGTNHIGEIRTLNYIAQPNIAIITNIGPSHLEFLGDVEGVFRAKTELLENFNSDSIAVLNGDDERLSRIKEQRTKYKIITFGFNTRCEFVASSLSYKDGHLTFLLNGRDSIELKTPAKANVYNALAAIATSSIFEVDPVRNFAFPAKFGISNRVDLEIIKDALSSFVFPSMRMEVKQIQGLRIIDDSYNSNPQSLCVAIRTLLEQDSLGKRILVAGDMLELGEKAGEFHYDIGKLVAKSKIDASISLSINPERSRRVDPSASLRVNGERSRTIDLLITVGELSKNICQGALDGGMEEGAVLSCSSNQEAIDCLLRYARSGDVVLIKGSRAIKMEEITRCFIASFTH